LIIADKEQSFALGVISLLLDSQKASLLGREGRKVIEKKYSWDSITTNFQASMENYVDGFLKPSERINENRN
jgi:hypothetical protein